MVKSLMTFAQATAPKTNRAFWNAKFRRNVRRDQEHKKIWFEQGWNVIVIWECALKTVAEREKTFALVPQDKVKSVYEYCNLHGLWKA